jgi:serine protease Do
VAQVAAGSPADKSGLKEGDIIVTFDGQDIPTSSDLPHVVGLIEPGRRVDVEIVRERKPRKIEVEVGGLDADDSYSLAAGSTEKGYGGRLGLVVETAQPETLERWGINGGVVVREVVPESAAATAGIVPGDVITLIGSRPVKSKESYERVVEGLSGGSSVPLRLIRRGSPMFIGLKLDD